MARSLRKVSFLLGLVVLAGAGAAAPALARGGAGHKSPGPKADPAPQAEIPGGQLQVLQIAGKTPDAPMEFPLKHTDVRAEISGFVARVEVQQTYVNPFKDRIEAVYTFPLPEDSAVDEMEMTVGDRVIKGNIKKREEAKQIYDEARRNGQTAALLDQERPNIFTQSVANVRPGEKVTITIRYVAVLKYDAGEYEFNFPTVVGPRYIPGEALPDPQAGGGFAKDTDRVPDASRVTPPVLKPGERSGHDISLKVHLDAGLAVQALRSPSHVIGVDKKSDSVDEITLSPSDTIPNKDFILRYKVAGKLPEAAVLAHHDKGDKHGYFTVMIQPQAQFTTDAVTPKEMIFVIDTSGSMRGAPEEKAKELMRRSIDQMNPNDSFLVLDFDDKVSSLSPRPLANTAENRKKAHAYVDSFEGSGGTNLLSAIEAVLNLPPDPDRMRIVVFITDGYIGNETEILGRMQKNLGQARLFTFGAGTSVNHYLLDGMALEGRGYTQYVRPDEDTSKVVTQFYARIANPLLTDVTIDWKGLDVEDQYPAQIPDLFSSQPVYVHGRYGKGGKATVVMHGKIAGKPFKQEIAVDLPAERAENTALGSIWARQRIADLDRKNFRGEQKEVVDQITETALEHHLMSKYTSFVAVEEKTVADPKGGPPRKIVQPVELPEGVSYEGVFGGDADKKGEAVYRSAGSTGSASGYGYGSGGGQAQTRGRSSVNAPATASPSPVAPPPPTGHKGGAGKAAPMGENENGRDGLGGYSGPPAKEPMDVGDAPSRKPTPTPKEKAPAPEHATGSLSLDGLTWGGQTADGGIVQALRATLPALKKVFVGATAKSGATGVLTVELVIAADGTISKATIVRDTIGDAGLSKSVEQTLRTTKLPKPTGGKPLTVTFSLTFSE